VLTPSEALAAAALGCRLLKLFPASMGGPAYLRALRAPLDDLQFVPAGGITLETIGAYRHAGAVAVAVGSELTGRPGAPATALCERAAAFVAKWEGSHDG
jgi:2-dehydro-3-deoxyphosphogluconate aldolase / (4S)-4-hydroxy-2-oxoglutarate aldolase